MIRLSFHGAAHGVTGSCFLLECDSTKILIDCGLFQGSQEISDENKEPFGFKPSQINYLLLTHGHLDHCGRIPLLVKQGFKGEIITTSATRELAKLVMLDSGHLHEEEAKRKLKYIKRHSKKKNKSSAPLYNTIDVMNAMDRFGTNAVYEKPLKLSRNITATFFDAGHILGSASIFLEIEENDKTYKLLFSGDIGNNGKPIIRDPVILPECDYAVMETTYGDRSHRSLKESVNELYQAINDTFSRGGNVYIPTFALERAQDLLFYLRKGVEEKKLPNQMQIFLDSPMAISATEIYYRHPECFDAELQKLFKARIDPFYLPNLNFTRDVAESVAINKIKSGAVIMAGSGMCTGGRICHHLKHNLWRKECSVVFVSFAADGTLGRKIIDGAKTVNIYGEQIDVNSQIYTINGFSAHAGHDELISWHKKLKNPKTTFLVHGSQEAMANIASDLKKHGAHILMPKLHQEFKLTN